MAELALGTVAFGIDYGITNADGAPSDAEMTRMLVQAHDGGVTLFDTAADYGRSQQRLGELMPPEYSARYITKFSLPTDGALSTRDNLFGNSMAQLGVSRVAGVLFHKLADLDDVRCRDAVAILREARSEGVIERAGVSVYHEDDLSRALSVFEDLDIVQLPANACDTELLSSSLVSELHERGVQIHVRSAFLQGLVFANPDALPEFFAPLAPALRSLRAEAARSATSVQSVALGALKFHPNVDVVLAGANSSDELGEILAAWQAADRAPQLAIDPLPREVLDPRVWPATKVTT